MCILENGKIIVTYTGHAATSALRYRITEKPYDIYSFGPEQTLVYDGDTTYAQIFENTKKNEIWLFIRDMVASNARPLQQLIAFDKVYFEANERKTIEFTITDPMLRFWDNENKFVSEPGEFQISTGYADRLVLTESFNLI